MQAGGSRKLYTGPIPVNSSAKYRIAAYKDGMSFDNYSERLNLTLTVVNSGPVTPPTPDPPTCLYSPMWITANGTVTR